MTMETVIWMLVGALIGLFLSYAIILPLLFKFLEWWWDKLGV